MATPFFTNEQLPTTSEQAIRIFDERYLAVLSMAQPEDWIDPFISTVGAPRVTYPLSAFSAKFRPTTDTAGKFKSFLENSFDLKVVEYDEGYEAPKIDLLTSVFAYRNWMKAPEAFAIAERRLMSKALAGLLDKGESTVCPYDGVDFFSTSHLANPFDASLGTWSNYQSTSTGAAVIANIQAEATNMRAGVLDANGDRLKANPKEIWVAPENFQPVSDLLNEQRLANGASNPIYGRYTVRELTDLGISSSKPYDWYLVDPDLVKLGFDPLIMLQYMPGDSLGLRFFDESSDYFKNTSKIKVSKHIWNASGLVYPHAIRKVHGTTSTT